VGLQSTNVGVLTIHEYPITKILATPVFDGYLTFITHTLEKFVHSFVFIPSE